MSPRLRVLLTADTVGGVWSYALELARALARHGVEVALATLGGEPDGDQRSRALEVEGLRLFTSEFSCEWMEDPWEDVARAGDWLEELAEELNPDLVHLDSYSHAARSFSAPVLVVGHSCVCSWWRAVHGEEAPERWGAYRRSVSRGIASADRIVAPTRAMLRSLERDYGPLPPASVIHNGRCPAEFRPLRKEPRIFACGRLWDDAKNLSALDQVAPDLPWPVEVAGSLRHPGGGERSAPNVRRLGSLTPGRIADRMGRASICVHPARYEPFGLVPLEAALSGCALVLGDIPTLREIWGSAALYVDPEEPAELRDQILLLIGSDRLRSRLAARARKRALQLTPGRMADRYLDLYRSLRREGRSRTPRPMLPTEARA